MTQQSTEVKYAGKICQLNTPGQYPQAEGKANSYYCPLGPEPGRAWVLMLRSDVDAIQADGNINAANRLEFRTGSKVARFPKMYLHKAHNVSGGPLNQISRCYLLELLDKRKILRMASARKHYNMLTNPQLQSASTALEYHSSSLDSGTVWTWQTMLSDMWGLLPASISGTAPTIPVSLTPTGEPCNVILCGSVLDKIADQLQRIGCALQYDPIADTFSYARQGAPQAGLAGALARYPLFLDDADAVRGDVTWIPETIQVVFNRIDRNHGAATPSDWHLDGLYVETVLAAQYHSNASYVVGTSIMLWDDLVAIADCTTGALNNAAAITARAIDRAVEYMLDNRGLDTQAGTMRKQRIILQGICPEIKTGSEVQAVLFRNFGDGFVTEVRKRENWKDHGIDPFPPYPPLRYHAKFGLAMQAITDELQITITDVPAHRKKMNTGGWSLTNSVITVPRTGLYKISLRCEIEYNGMPDSVLECPILAVIHDNVDEDLRIMVNPLKFVTSDSTNHTHDVAEIVTGTADGHVHTVPEHTTELGGVHGHVGVVSVNDFRTYSTCGWILMEEGDELSLAWLVSTSGIEAAVNDGWIMIESVDLR